MAFSTKRLVSPTAYFVYVNGKADAEAFDGKLEFDVELIPYTGSDTWVEPAIYDLKKMLMSDEIPPIGTAFGGGPSTTVRTVRMPERYFLNCITMPKRNNFAARVRDAVRRIPKGRRGVMARSREQSGTQAPRARLAR